MYIFYSSELPGHLVTNNSKQLVMNNSQQLVTDSSEQPLLADFLVKSSEVGNWWNYHSILMCVSPSWMKAFCETCKDAVIYALVNQRRHLTGPARVCRWAGDGWVQCSRCWGSAWACSDGSSCGGPRRWSCTSNAAAKQQAPVAAAPKAGLKLLTWS